MKQLGFYIDAAKCTGCKTCVVACKDAHDLPVGMNLRKVIEYAGGDWRQDRMTGAWHQDVFAYYLSIACNHCEDPACVKVCPTKAHFKRKEDGLVVIDREKCIGCGACAAACPYGAPQLDVKAKKMLKCDGCLDRLEKGLAPRLRRILHAAGDRIRTDRRSSQEVRINSRGAASSRHADEARPRRPCSEKRPSRRRRFGHGVPSLKALRPARNTAGRRPQRPTARLFGGFRF